MNNYISWYISIQNLWMVLQVDLWISVHHCVCIIKSSKVPSSHLGRRQIWDSWMVTDIRRTCSIPAQYILRLKQVDTGQPTLNIWEQQLNKASKYWAQYRWLQTLPLGHAWFQSRDALRSEDIRSHHLKGMCNTLSLRHSMKFSFLSCGQDKVCVCPQWQRFA